MPDDGFDLQRFVTAQDAVYAQVLAELRRGRKASHWMWFVFPQIAGLGRSPTSVWYAISGLAEAQAYLAHPVLGPRLRDCAGIVAGIDAVDAVSVFGGVDAQKLHSSMTLFRRAGPDDTEFGDVLARFFDGRDDPATVDRLGDR